MKNKWNIIPVLFGFILASALFFSSCEEDDNKKEWGYSLIYMPQASILNGGLVNNDYPVPLNNNAATKNYELDETGKILKIYLGVYRAGLEKLESYSVQIAVDAAATAAAATASNRVVLPEGSYTLPAQITVPKGEREANFLLTVDLNKLDESYATRRIVLVVGISNPTRYELNEDLSKTTVVIDGSVFL